MGSIDRVREAALAAGLAIDIRRMDGSTRTAEEAAAQCGCSAAEIVKSLIFVGEETGKLKLFLVGGDRQLDLAKANAIAGEEITRADPRRVREVTGFAIGGVAPIGHLSPCEAFADEGLMRFDVVWAAAGAPDAVFASDPAWLVKASGARLADLSG
jgi:prolyl-tRNA editing enzyme YbaK/EbsC (Cys-tRNA(Pro) deacylase)